jgi:dTDP-glucose 4,6-dehydratase
MNTTQPFKTAPSGNALGVQHSTLKTILVTGCAGFIGSNFVPYFLEKYPNYRIVNLDLLTYAGNLENLKEIDTTSNHSTLNTQNSKPVNELVTFILEC